MDKVGEFFFYRGLNLYKNLEVGGWTIDEILGSADG